VFFDESPGDFANQQTENEEHDRCDRRRLDRACEVTAAEHAPTENGHYGDQRQSGGELLGHGGFRGTDLNRVGYARSMRGVALPSVSAGSTLRMRQTLTVAASG
jgi:hypothetical protein